MKRRTMALLGALGLLTGGELSARRAAIGDTTVFATLPPFPGFPEQPLTAGRLLYVCTDAHFGTVGAGPPEVQIFDRRSGALADRVPIAGTDTTVEHGMSAGAFDAFGRLYVLSVQQGVVRIDFRTGAQDVYAPPMPTLPICGTVPDGTDCSPKLAPFPALANDIVFDRDGNAYISDSFQATIFRVPPGGGAPQIWFQDERLVGPVGGFGTNGMRFSPDGEHLFVNVTTEAATGDGVVYALRKVEHPSASDLVEFHRFTGGSGSPDDMAFGVSGRLYVSLPFQNQMAILDRDGREVTRFPDAEQAAALTVPFDMPSGIAFDDATRSIYITNHAELTEDPAHMVVFRSFVDDTGWPLIRPPILP